MSLNTAALQDPALLTTLANRYGSQAIIVAIDAKRVGDRYPVFSYSGTRETARDAVEWAREATDRGAGEILLTSIDRDGTMNGYDLELVSRVSAQVQIPVIACGGAGAPDHLVQVIKQGGAAAAAAGSLFVFHGRYRAVLINYPSAQSLQEILT